MTVTVHGPGAYSKQPYGSFANKPAAADSKNFVRNFSVLGPGGYSRPLYGSFAGKTATSGTDSTRGSETILTDRRGAGPHFSRREFDKFLKAKRAAEAKARHLKKKAGAELRKAVEIAEEVREELGLWGDFAPSIEPITDALFDAAGANVAQVAADRPEKPFG
jgi:hypothetical protein